MPRRTQRTPTQPALAYSIKQFCSLHGISLSTYFKLQRAGHGPRVTKAGHRALISVEAANAWRAPNAGTMPNSPPCESMDTATIVFAVNGLAKKVEDINLMLSQERKLFMRGLRQMLAAVLRPLVKNAVTRRPPPLVPAPVVDSSDGRRNFIRIKEVSKRTGQTSAQIYRAVHTGTFPKSIKLGHRSVVWVEHEIDDYVDALIKQRETT